MTPPVPVAGDPSADPGELLEVAVAAARRVVPVLLDRSEALRYGTKSTSTDVVTVKDTESERLIREHIRSARPGDAFLGEESGSAAGSSSVRWIVDPIDGTVNYLYDIPQYAVSIAAEVDGEVVAAVVLDPSRDELFTAIAGRGAWRNDQPIHCGAPAELAKSLIGTGFGYAAERRARQARVVAEVLPRVRDIRRLGAASLDLCAVACGRLDGYYEFGLKHWDLAAGGLIVTEAGARLDSRQRGEEFFVTAAAPGIFESLAELLERLAAADV